MGRRRAFVALLVVLVCAIMMMMSSSRVEGKEYKGGLEKVFSVENSLRKLLPVNQDPSVKGSGGGTECIGCTLVVSIVEQLSQIHNKTVDKVLGEICGWLPIPLSTTCEYFVIEYGNIVIDGLEAGLRPDDVCQNIGVCTDATCRLFPKSKQDVTSKLESHWKRVHHKVNKLSSKAKIDPWKWLEDLFESLIQHRPLLDEDGDKFSVWKTLRGSYWRGKDCNDLAGDIYPGRNVSDYPDSVDHNCNGIYGRDPNTGKSYEDLFCKDTDQFGTIVIGDSAAAHFHIPVGYFDPRLMTENTFNHILSPFIEDEFDWPMKNWACGYLTSNFSGDVPGLTDSIYLRQRQRNLCNHRDYQTLAVNGARSSSVMGGNITESISRMHTTDQPALVFYALIGNDVCSGHHTFADMTTPAEFEHNVLESLYYLDSGVLPAGSNVVFIGLANGSLLYQYLHARDYPLSPEVTYEDVYDYLNCLHSSPCWVWMNNNQTVRDTGTQRAMELSQVYNKIIQTYKFKNFNMTYLDFPIAQVTKMWEAMGGQFYQLIEPLDGFHPNQNFQALQARAIWENLEATHPQFFSRLNPNNLEIEKIFGDQGGY